MTAQNLEKHQWKERLVLVITSSMKNETFKKQLSELQNDKNGLKERKLIVYQIEPKKFRTGTDYSGKWYPNKSPYQTFNKAKKAFKVLLIGLDGEVKLEQSELLSTVQLFNTIDAMPMRRAEMNNKQ